MKKKILISTLVAMFICIAPGLSAKAGAGKWSSSGESGSYVNKGNGSWTLQAQSDAYESQKTKEQASLESQKIAKEYENKGKSEKTLVKPNPYNLIDSFGEGRQLIDESNKIYSRTTQVKATDLVSQEHFKQWAEAQTGSAEAMAYEEWRDLQYIEYNQTIIDEKTGKQITGATIYHYIRYPRIMYTETATQYKDVVLDTQLKYYVWRYYCYKDPSQNSVVESNEKYREFTPGIEGKWTVTATPFYFQTRTNYQGWTANATTQYIKRGSGQASAPPQTFLTASGKRNYETFSVDIGENENEKRTWNFDFTAAEVKIKKTPEPEPQKNERDGYTYSTSLTQ